ncbi:mucin-binding protein, partial [Lactobacillus porci]|uniref:mucin-binding protein n=1 Tax=Lactobacillus porci TaxID=2012477 RepID=UPI003992F042
RAAPPPPPPPPPPPTATIAIPKTDNVMAAAKKTAKYSYSVQTKKITRTIKMYQPKGVKKVVQKAYIKRKVKTNKKTKKKTYGKWSTSSWKKYKVAKVSGYTASRATVGAAKVTQKTKNQTVKITYKAIKHVKKHVKKTNKKRTTKRAIKKPAKKAVKKPVKKSTPKKTVRRSVPASANLTFYSSKGKPTSFWPAKDGLEKAPKKGDKVEVLGQGIINGQLMYEIAQDSSVYVPAKDVRVDYFKNVKFVDYYHGSGTPAQNKAKYDADLAYFENSHPEDGFTDWFEAHPLEDLRMWSKKTKVSKSTYEKHNLTYAQYAASYGRDSIGYTKESYTAYINGEKAYRQYEAKWAAEHPNITRYMEELFKNDSDYKKYNLNTFEWHYNDNFFINIRK